MVATFLIVGVVGCSKKASPTSGLPSAGSGTGGVSADGSTSASATTAQKSAAGGATSAASSAGSGGSSASGAGSSAGGSTATKKPSATTPGGAAAVAPAAQTMDVRIMWWNDTNGKAPNGIEIVIAGKSYKPSGAKAQGVLGPVEVGKQLDVTVYPDGRNGKKIVVPFMLTSEMQSASERDAIHVSVSDTTVRVLGNPVSNFDQSFPRQ